MDTYLSIFFTQYRECWGFLSCKVHRKVQRARCELGKISCTRAPAFPVRSVILRKWHARDFSATGIPSLYESHIEHHTGNSLLAEVLSRMLGQDSVASVLQPTYHPTVIQYRADTGARRADVENPRQHSTGSARRSQNSAHEFPRCFRDAVILAFETVFPRGA